MIDKPHIPSLQKWCKNKGVSIRNAGIDIEIIEADVSVDNPAFAVSLFGSVVCGRLTIWSSGNLEIEILCNENSKAIFMKSTVIDALDSHDVHYDKFLEEIMRHEGKTS